MSSEIAKFYKNTNILITGGMGFLGKILVQKLFRECPDIQGIYMIVRGKKGKTIQRRMDEILQDPIFDLLKKSVPDYLERIFLVEGDCSRLDLGLSKGDRSMLIDKINVVFHMAASLNMDSKIRDAVEINVRGTREMLEMCKEMTELKALVYVSTAYSNCNHTTIEEKFYKPKISGRTLISLTEELDDKSLNELTPTLLSDMPNTYIYTKCASEDIIYNEAMGLPLAIFRPSIVQSSYEDPVPGWTDNYYGPNGIVVSVFSGLSRFGFCTKSKRFDVVPVDYCANALISCAWDLQNRLTDKSEEKFPIYNYSAGLEKSLNWDKFRHILWKVYKQPLSKALWVTHFCYVEYRYLYYLLVLMFHYFPALLIDTCCLIVGKKPQMIRMYNKLHRLLSILEYFGFREFNIKNTNVYAMWAKLNKTDREKFPFDINSVDWTRFYANSYLGIKYYLMKDDPNNADKDKSRYRRLQIIDKTLLYGSVSLALYGGLKYFGFSYS